MNKNQTSSHIKKLEKELLTQKVRKNPDKLNQLLDDNFIEIGSSGRAWTKQEVIEVLKNEPFVEVHIRHIKFTLLDEKVGLITYLANRKMTKNKPDADSYHSSIWVLREYEWKMIFHQGTVIASSGKRNL